MAAATHIRSRGMCGLCGKPVAHCPLRKHNWPKLSTRYQTLICMSLERPPVQAPVQTGEQHAPALSTSDFKAVDSYVQIHPLRNIYKRVLKELSSLPRAIGLMAAIFCMAGIGTVIPQSKALSFYVEKYPDHGQQVLGFLSYHWVLALQLDHIYSAWYFYASLVLMGASLMACTSTRQLPALKFAQNWRFMTASASFTKMKQAEVLPKARVGDLGSLLSAKNFQVFLADGKLYAFKGLAGRFGPIGVHLALLLVLAGTGYSTIGGFKGSVMVPEGQGFLLSSSMHPASPLAIQPKAAKSVMHVNKFDIDYRPDGQVAQFYSDLTLTDLEERELYHKRVSVNDPFRYGGITMYQTDWALSSVTLNILNPDASSAPVAALDLPFASLEGRPGIQGRMWATFLPIATPFSEDQVPRGVSVLARDPQSVLFYDGDGKFVGVRRPGSGKRIEVEGILLSVESITGATGLEIKSDPAVPWIYAGFAGVMISTAFSCMSHCQVWALQHGNNVYVLGKSNKAAILFEKELGNLLDKMPEHETLAAVEHA